MPLKTNGASPGAKDFYTYNGSGLLATNTEYNLGYLQVIVPEPLSLPGPGTNIRVSFWI